MKTRCGPAAVTGDRNRNDATVSRWEGPVFGMTRKPEDRPCAPDRTLSRDHGEADGTEVEYGTPVILDRGFFCAAAGV